MPQKGLAIKVIHTYVLNILQHDQQRNSWKRYIVRAILFFPCLSENMEYYGSINDEKRYPLTMRWRTLTLHIKNYFVVEWGEQFQS